MMFDFDVPGALTFAQLKLNLTVGGQGFDSTLAAIDGVQVKLWEAELAGTWTAVGEEP